MNATATWRLFWKEYRTQRGYWLAVLIFGFACQMLAWISFGDGWTRERNSIVWSAAMFIPTVAVIGSAAALFAGERELGTDDLLRRCSISLRAVLAGKIGFAAAGTIATIALLVLVALFLTFQSTSRFDYTVHAALLAFAMLLLVELLAWGCLFSLVFDRPINAVAGSLVATVVVYALIGGAADGFNRLDPRDLLFDWATIGWSVHLAGLAAVLVADVWLARHWLTTPIDWRLPRFEAFRLVHSRPALRIVSAPAPRSQLGSLVWLAARQAWPSSMLVLAATALAALVAAEANRDFDSFRLIGIFVVMPVFLGVMSFREEMSEGRFQFFAERGVAPATVWLSKQIVWLTLLIASVAACAGILLFLRAAPSSPPFGSGLIFPETWADKLIQAIRNPFDPSSANIWNGVGAAATIALLVYAIGQLVTLLVRSTVTAVVVALGLTTLAVPINLLALMPAKLSLFVPVLAIAILVFAALIRARDLMLARAGRPALFRLSAALAIPFAALFASTAAVRVYSIPANGPGFDVAEFMAPKSAEALETGATYRKLVQSLAQTSTVTTSASLALESWEKFSEGNKQFLKDNENLVAPLVENTKRLECAFAANDAADNAPSNDVGQAYRLTDLLLFSAREREAAGDLGAAFGRYHAVVRMGRHFSQSRGPGDWYGAAFLESEALRWMSNWINHPKQTAGSLATARAALTEHFKTRLSLHDSIRTDYVLVLNHLDHPWWLFWEKARDQRLLAATTKAQLEGAETIEWALDAEQSVDSARLFQTGMHSPLGKRCLEWASTSIRLPEFVPELKYRASFISSVTSLVMGETARRGVILQLALAEWRLSRGRLPDSLSELFALDPNLVLTDPFSGDLFGYRPAGMPVRLYFHQGGGFQPGTPVLWSTGGFFSHLVAKTLRSPEGQRTVHSFQFRTHGMFEKHPSLGVAGWAFPLAAAKAQN